MKHLAKTIDNMGRIEIPIILLNELKLEKKDKIIIETDDGVLTLRKKN